MAASGGTQSVRVLRVLLSIQRQGEHQTFGVRVDRAGEGIEQGVHRRRHLSMRVVARRSRRCVAEGIARVMLCHVAEPLLSVGDRGLCAPHVVGEFAEFVVVGFAPDDPGHSMGTRSSFT